MVKQKNIVKEPEKSKKLFSSIFRSKGMFSILAVAAGILVGFWITAIVGFSIGDITTIWFNANFGRLTDFGTLIGNFIWLAFIGLSLLVGFRAGIFNIGAAGQLVAGGMSAYWLGSILSMGPSGVVVVLLFGVLIASLVAVLIGLLKTQFKIHEVVSSIMINWIIFYAYRFIDPESMTLLSDNSLQAVWLTNAFNGAENINIGIFFLILIPAFWALYKFTTFGYKQDILGSNPNASHYIGINKRNEQLKTFAISGALAGLAGVIVFNGQDNPPFEMFTSQLPPMFFHGITISLLAANSPIGLLFATFVVASLETAASEIGTVTNGVPISDIILAVTLLFVAAFSIFEFVHPWTKIKQLWNAPDEVSDVTKGGDK